MVGQILLAALAEPLGLPSFASVIAIMLGLGAGIDYALLIIGRYREQVAAGDSRRDASAKSAATSGASVVAAGLVVMLAIAGLLVIGIPFIGKLGLAAAIAVGAVVVSALTILPIMIGAVRPLAGAQEARARARRRRPSGAGARSSPRGRGSRSPPACSSCCCSRRRSPSCGSASPTTATSPRARPSASPTTASARRSAPGSNGPFLLAIDIPKGAAEQRGAAGEAPAGGRGHARHGARSRRPRRARTARWRRSSPSRRPRRRTQRTSDLLERLREDVIPGAVAGTPLKVYVGGNTAGFEDFSDKVASRLPVFIAVVIGLSVLLLIMAFRSLWIPLVSARLQPAVGRRGLRRRRRGLPGGLRREPARRRLRRPDRVVHPGDDVRDPVRAEHGLQRLPALAHPRGLQRGRRAARERDPRHGADRQGDPVRRPDHGRRLPRLRHPARRDRRRCSASASAWRS